MSGPPDPLLPSWVAALDAVLSAGERAVLVLVAEVSGSVPRESGAAMVVTHDGQAGTVGGGHLEYEAVRIARESLRVATPGTSLVRFPLAARVGQCCGGVATLAFSVVDTRARSWLDAVRACVRAGFAFGSVARLGNGDDAAARLVVSADDARGSLGDPGLDSAAIAFVRARLAAGAAGTLEMPIPGSTGALVVQLERPDPFPVLLFGNGHVARALVQVLGVLPMQVRWVDAREGDFPVSVPANVLVVDTDVPEAEVRTAPPGTFLLTMTHSHALDFTIIETALARSDWRYVGMIGSNAKRAQLERRLLARGVARERLAGVVCPIGAPLPGLAGKAPGAIAITVAAELMATKAAGAVHRIARSRAAPAR